MNERKPVTDTPVHVAMIEVRWVGGDIEQIKQRIEEGLEVLGMLVGGMDEHGILSGHEADDDNYAAPEESATFVRFMQGAT